LHIQQQLVLSIVPKALTRWRIIRQGFVEHKKIYSLPLIYVTY